MKTIGGKHLRPAIKSSSLMPLLEKELRKKISSGPMYEKEDKIVLRYFHAFEPHGRASETWEDVWMLELPLVQSMHHDRSGDWSVWRKGHPMVFFGREFQDVATNAINFLMEADWIVLETE